MSIYNDSYTMSRLSRFKCKFMLVLRLIIIGRLTCHFYNYNYNI